MVKSKKMKSKFTTHCAYCNGEHPDYVAGCSACGGTEEWVVEVEHDICHVCGSDNGPIPPYAQHGRDRIGHACCACMFKKGEMMDYAVIGDRKHLESIVDTFTFWIASNAQALEKLDLTATVEAEFGSDVVEGNLHTLAHHGPRADNYCPCEVPILPIQDGSTVGLSHIDLDTLGGCLRLAGYAPFKGTTEFLFWRLAADLDRSGPHKLPEIIKVMMDEGITNKEIQEVVDRYHAWCAWSSENRYYPPRHDDAIDCSGFIHNAIRVIMDILEGNQALLAAGQEWLSDQKVLDIESFQNIIAFPNGSVIVRIHKKFVNHLYRHHLHGPADLVLAHNTMSGAVTLSKADESFPVDCSNLMKELFGDGAGGRASIAGSPRGKIVSKAGFNDALHRLISLLEENL